MDTLTQFRSTRPLREVDNVALYRQKLERRDPPGSGRIRWVLAASLPVLLVWALYQLV